MNNMNNMNNTSGNMANGNMNNTNGNMSGNNKRNTYNKKSFDYIFDSFKPNTHSLPIFENYPTNTRLNNNNQMNRSRHIQNYQSLPMNTAMPINGNTLPDISIMNPVSTRTNDIKQNQQNNK